MAQLQVSDEAQADLRRNAEYTQTQWGKKQRNAYLDKLKLAFSRISNHPLIGQPCDHILPGYRYTPVGQHLVFYRVPHDGRVEIIRILHRSRFVDPVFRPGRDG